jgi:hypothetical protein
MNRYFILDISTGIHDGFYTDIGKAWDSFNLLKESYPDIPWIVCDIRVEPDDWEKFCVASDNNRWTEKLNDAV